MEPTKVGRIADNESRRDAIHVAIAPVTASELLRPGQHIGVRNGKSVDNYPVGVVDPYLTVSVREGQTFWLFLYPNTVTTLRHSWTHPCFADDLGDDDKSNPSAEWLKAWCAINGIEYRELMTQPLEDLCRNDDSDIPYCFWVHYEAVRGLIVPEDDRYIRCAC